MVKTNIEGASRGRRANMEEKPEQWESKRKGSHGSQGKRELPVKVRSAGLDPTRRSDKMPPTRVYISSLRGLPYLWDAQALATPAFQADGYLLSTNVTLTLECSHMCSWGLISS